MFNAKEYYKQYNKEHADKNKEAVKRYQASQKGKATKQEWVKNNREKAREAVRKWSMNNPDKVRANTLRQLDRIKQMRKIVRSLNVSI